MPETDFLLTQGDCVAGMKELPDECIDIVVTSPPYNLGIQYGKYDDQRDWPEYKAWTLEWTSQVSRVLKPTGSFFLNLGSCPSNPLLPHELVVELKGHFVLQNTFHWIKSITVDAKSGEQISAGHFKPINSRRFVNDCHEYIFHLTHTGEVPIDRLGMGVPYTHKSNIARWGHTQGRDLRCRGNNWFIPYKTIMYRSRDRPHPATFPTQLAANCIKIHGNASELVMLDPFLGIGHSALAAKECGVKRFYGFEIDAEYLEVARAALKNGAASDALPAVESPEKPPPRKRGPKPKPRMGGGENNQITLL